MRPEYETRFIEQQQQFVTNNLLIHSQQQNESMFDVWKATNSKKIKLELFRTKFKSEIKSCVCVVCSQNKLFQFQKEDQLSPMQCSLNTRSFEKVDLYRDCGLLRRYSRSHSI